MVSFCRTGSAPGIRIFLPILALLLLLFCARSLLTFRKEPGNLGLAASAGGNQIRITHWESVIGRNKHSDIVIDLPTISRSHAVLTRYDDRQLDHQRHRLPGAAFG